MGTPLMPWQQQVLDVALEIDPATKRFVYREVVLTVPRQSGKTTLLLVLILTRALAEPGQNIRYTAQTGSDARKKWMDDWLPILGPSEFSQFFRVRLTNGHEALIFNNGSHQGLVATTKKSGHGGTLDLAILDEAFAHPDARLEQALKPATITRPQPQFWVVSTAGTFEDSPYLWSKVENGRQMVESGATTAVCYFEWSAPDDADPEDEATWRSCMPALGLTASVEAVRAELEGMESMSEFRRAFLNQWVQQLTDPVIPLELWNALVDEESSIVGPGVFAYDVSPDRSTSAISHAGRRRDGAFHVEVVDHRAGVGWLIPRLIELRDGNRRTPILCDPMGPAGTLIPELNQHRIEVTEVTGNDHAKACGFLYDDVLDQKLRHFGTIELAYAINGAAKRPLGDAWAWSRKGSGVDICPLVATTIALWGAHTLKLRRARVFSIDDLEE